MIEGIDLIWNTHWTEYVWENILCLYNGDSEIV